jgi:uncharacterized glyoxalase superfamily protein PhnB
VIVATGRFDRPRGAQQPVLEGGRAVSVDSVGALLLISDDAESLAAFYRDALGFPLEDEVHDGVPLHYGCEIGGVHFAIHPSAEWPGERIPNAQSPVIVFYTSDVQAAYARLVASGVEATPPFDHGFATLTAFRDPDGNNVQVMTPAE